MLIKKIIFDFRIRRVEKRVSRTCVNIELQKCLKSLLCYVLPQTLRPVYVNKTDFSSEEVRPHKLVQPLSDFVDYLPKIT